MTLAVELQLRNLQIRERQIEDQNLKRDVLSAIFGITAPRRVVDKAIHLVLQEKFYRKGYRAEYFLEPVTLRDASGKEIKAINVTSFDVRH